MLCGKDGKAGPGLALALEEICVKQCWRKIILNMVDPDSGTGYRRSPAAKPDIFG